MTRIFALIIIVNVVITVGSPLEAQTDTVFTYQGELKENGGIANGVFNLDFTLWDVLAGGNQIGPEVMFNAQPVVDGRFTVELDFGASAFNNTGRWLETSVDGTKLSPRQPITRAPYSIQTRGIVVDENNNVGIGTNAPDEALHVKSPGAGIGAGIHVEDDGGASEAEVYLSETGDSGFKMSYSSQANQLQFIPRVVGADSSVALMIDRSNGNVGIGTSTPSYPLHVVSNSETAISGETQITVGVSGRSDGNSGTGVYGEATLQGNGTSYGGRFRSNSNIGRGVEGIATCDAGALNYGVLGISNSPGGRGVEGHGNASSGSNIGVFGRSDSQNGFDFYAGGFGTNYGASSSRRWKNNVVPIDDPLNKLAQLRGVYYDWDEEHGGAHDVGMIAEEVGAVMPEIVNYEENGIDAIGMDYSKMTPLLVEAVNALRTEKDAEIVVLRSENATHRARLDSLEQKNNELQQQVQDLLRLVERLASTTEKSAK